MSSISISAYTARAPPVASSVIHSYFGYLHTKQNFYAKQPCYLKISLNFSYVPSYGKQILRFADLVGSAGSTPTVKAIPVVGTQLEQGHLYSVVIAVVGAHLR